MFLYFIPTPASEISPANLQALGLAYLGLRQNPAARTVRTGPGGRSGLIFDAVGGSARFQATTQTWHAGPDAKYFVGHAQDEPFPTPAELAKKRFIAGEALRLGQDGSLWTIPACRSLVRGTTLPQSLALGPDGKSWKLAHLPEFVALCQTADRIWADVQRMLDADPSADGNTTDGNSADGEPANTAATDAPGAPGPNVEPAKPLAVAECADVAVQALGVNYRLGAVEASAMALLDTDSVQQICLAMVDWFEIERVTARSRTDASKKTATPVT